MLTFIPNVTWAAVRLQYTQTPDTTANTTTLTITSIEVRSTQHAADYYPDGVLAVDGATLLTFRRPCDRRRLPGHHRGRAHHLRAARALWKPGGRG